MRDHIVSKLSVLYKVARAAADLGLTVADEPLGPDAQDALDRLEALLVELDQVAPGWDRDPRGEQ